MTLDDLVRSDVDGLDDLADGSGLDEFAGLDGSLYFEAFAVENGVYFFGFGDGLANGCQVFKGSDAGFVAEEVFAVFHGAHADGGALVGDLRAEDELSPGIVDDLFLRGDDF